MTGATLGRYRVLEKLGEGGMGEVYRARDQHLDRDVALKVLPAGLLADESARRRFRREALALSRLNHPNIATVHDFATFDGHDVLVMEYVAGESMSDRLRAHPLGEAEAVRLATQLVEGLAAAHAEGVVHRDVKPGNLRILPDGRLKILDFGLATLRQAGPEGEQETRSVATGGVVAGTLPYMSPEQVRGDVTDARSDLYAVGVTLYEMVTGQPPFRDTNTLRLAEAIAHQPCPPPGRLAPALSTPFEQVILKCTEKDPALRYQSAADLLVDLRRLATMTASSGATYALARRRRPWLRLLAAGIGGAVLLVLLVLAWRSGWLRRGGALPAGSPLRSVAVLPLANLSGDPQQEYFADGMTEALTTDLARIKALTVIARSSAMQYKGTKKSLPEIGRELGVGLVVEGSVFHAGNRVRIAAELVNTATRQQLWAQSFEREVRDVLSLLGEVASAIAREIQGVLTPAEAERLQRRRQVVPAAHEAYLRGLFATSRWTGPELDRAIGFFEQAIALDPAFAEAYAGLGFSCVIRGLAVAGGLSAERQREVLAKARSASARALELDDSLPVAHAVLATVAVMLDCDLPRGEEHVRRALELDRNSLMARTSAAVIAMVHGRREEARQEIARGVELDPLTIATEVEAGELSFWLGDYQRGIAYVRQGLERDPGFQRAHFVLARIYETQGRIPEAIAEYEKSYWSPGRAAAAREALASGGPSGFVRWRVSEAVAEGASGMYLASLYARLGQTDQAIATLERAYQAKEPMLFMLAAHEWFAPLRDDPRFVDLLGRLGLPQPPRPPSTFR